VQWSGLHSECAMLDQIEHAVWSIPGIIRIDNQLQVA
jgi:hypothetical protein